MFEIQVLNQIDLDRLLDIDEDHFLDLKSKDIKPAKLQESFVAFANADGGELFIGIEDQKYKDGGRVRPFINKEEANPILNVLLEGTEPAVEGVGIVFLQIQE